MGVEGGGSGRAATAVEAAEAHGTEARSGRAVVFVRRPAAGGYTDKARTPGGVAVGALEGP